MFQIRPAVPEDYYELRDCLQQRGKQLTLSPRTGIMTAIENGFAGLGLYQIEGEHAELLELLTKNEQDQELAFFIGKAVLNRVDLQGAKRVTCRNVELEQLLKKLEFVRTGEEWTLSLEGYFSSPCQRKKHD